MKIRPTSLLTLLTLVGIAPLARGDEPKDQQPRPAARLVSFNDLQGRLGDPDLRLLDVRPRADYDRGHIPGAIWVDAKATEELAARPGGLTEEAAWEAWIAPLAIGPETEVLIYDANCQKDAARFWWLLGYLGVEKVGLIDGGYPLWAKEGRPVTTDVPEVQPRPFDVTFRHARHATRAEVLESLKSGKARIIDARSEAEHTGEQRLSKRAGRIPSACNLEWANLVDKDGRFLPESDLRAKLAKAGVKPGEPVIAHCQGGGRASVDAFVFERLGHPTRNYYLGWSDWGNADETPVETGKPEDKDR
jgi:thiosulfate/3-mercaptopyruvate sulfurtransferase